MDFAIWQSILIMSGIQLVISFIIGIFVFQILAYLFKAKTLRWRTSVKLSAIINLLKSVILLVPYLFPESINTRIAIVIVGMLLLIGLTSYLVNAWYKLSMFKAVIIGLIFFIVLFLAGFPIGTIVGNLAYSLEIIAVPIL